MQKKAKTGADDAANSGAVDGAKAANADSWHATSNVEPYTGLDAAVRGQGIATDGEYFYFSGRLGMGKQKVEGGQTKQNQTAIQMALTTTYGINHIGGIDYFAGFIIAPIEDGPPKPSSSRYQHPLLVLYDKDALTYSDRFVKLPLSYLPGGVPWVAVDAVARLVYAAPWNQDAVEGTNRLIVFKLDDLLTLPKGSDLLVHETVTLSQPLSHIHGEKMFRGLLYASVDTTGDKSVYAIDPTSGTVSQQFQQNVGENDEVEDLAALDLGTGGQLHILNIGSGQNQATVYLRHYTDSTN
jgi:hypothetical protein